MNGWIGVDFDGTLVLENGVGFPAPGTPIPKMVNRVKGWLASGKDVRIMTARVGHCRLQDIHAIDPDWTGDVAGWISRQRSIVETWCTDQFGRELPVTCSKDLWMIELWDDRAVQMVPNTGMTFAEDHLLSVKRG